MNTTTGEIVDIYLDGGTTRARVRVGDDMVHVPLLLLMEARVGDWVVIQSGLATARLSVEQADEV